MIFETAASMDYLTLFLITIAMTLISRLFSWKFGGNLSQQMESQEKMRALQEEMMKSQNDPERMQQIQAEVAEMMSNMMKKQMIPMCIRSGFFLGIFALLGLFYGGIVFEKNPIQIFGSGYASLYFVYSIGLSLVYYLIKKIVHSFKPELKEKNEKFVDRARVLNSNLNLNDRSSQSNYSTQMAPITLSDELKKMRSDLLAKKKRGEIPSDIDINEEVRRIAIEEQETKLNTSLDTFNANETAELSPTSKESSKKSWKNRLSDD